MKLSGSLYRFLAKVAPQTWRRYERASEPRQFRDQLAFALNSQVKGSISEAVAATVSRLGKAQTVSNQVKQVVSEHFVPITTFMHGSTVEQFLKWSATAGGKAALRSLGVRGFFELTNGPFLERLGKRSAWLLRTIDDTTLVALQDRVVDAVKEGMTQTEIQSTIHSEFEDINPFRAETITRTEFANAAIDASRESYRRAGVEEWTWSQPPGGEDDECTQNDGETVPIGSAFPSGDKEPPLHPNCKCDVIPVPPDDFDPDGAWLGD